MSINRERKDNITLISSLLMDDEDDDIDDDDVDDDDIDDDDDDKKKSINVFRLYRYIFIIINILLLLE
jgi:hypothetical protein